MPGAAAAQSAGSGFGSAEPGSGRGSAEPAAGRASEPEPGSADPDRSGNARSARQGQDGDLLRQRAGGAGRHHDEMPEAGRVLRGRGRRAAAPPSRRLRVTAADGPATRRDAAGTRRSIRRIEARGGVTVVTKDQNASGDLGVYDLKTKTITLTGNVVVSQGKNVLHGERVVVDTATGNARVESGDDGTSRAGCGRSFSRARAPTAPRPMSCRSGRPRRIEGAAAGISGGKSARVRPRTEPCAIRSRKSRVLACSTSSHIFAGARPRHQPPGHRKPTAGDGAIDLASMGGTINGTYLDIASAPARDDKARNKTVARPPRQPPAAAPALPAAAAA